MSIKASTMTRFWLDRKTDETGVSGTGRVAEGVRFANGKVALSWLTVHTSTVIYDAMVDVVAIHGHGGKTSVTWQDEQPSAFKWGVTNCQLNICENSPFGSAGGLDARPDLQAPAYVPEGERAVYLDGYRYAAAEAYGADWRTCSFGWAPALVIPAPGLEVVGCTELPKPERREPPDGDCG